MDNLLLDEIYLNTEQYQKQFTKKERKIKAQFFTSKSTAFQMVEFLNCNYSEVTILEPGAGNGALTAALIVKLISKGCKNIECILVENDSAVLSLLTQNIQLMKSYARKNNVTLHVKLESDNYILKDLLNKVDIIIMNPPYKKIRKDSPESQKMVEYVHGQPNLYSLFMIKSLTLLKENGEFVFIVPRSWTSGDYYKISRDYILKTVDIQNICIFNKRDNSFSSEEVLQETMIFSGKKNMKQSSNINIIVSDDDSFTDIKKYKINHKIVKSIGINNYLLIPSNEIEIAVLKKFSQANKSFKDMGFEFKTGPVVEFRNKNSISIEKIKNSVPMFRTANIVQGKLLFPILNNKAQYILLKANKLLIKNSNTIFVRRLSSKEEKRRLQCCVYNAIEDIDYISIENHVNYLTKVDKSNLTKDEINYIFKLLMSDEYDAYFRLMNGNTQVNAKELNALPYIELE